MYLKTKKLVKIFLILLALLIIVLQGNICFASSATGIGTAEVQTATDNIKRVITSIAMPLGSVLIFASIVIAAIKIIANANNPQKRAESIGSLTWICGECVISLNNSVTAIKFVVTDFEMNFVFT